MDKADVQYPVSLAGVFITDKTECPVESLNIFSDKDLSTIWTETSKIELKVPNEIKDANLSVNRATPFRSKVYIQSQSTGYNLNI